jgi:hypothetical protein
MTRQRKPRKSISDKQIPAMPTALIVPSPALSQNTVGTCQYTAP